MTAAAMPQGEFTATVTLEIVRAPTFVRQEEGGVTYLTGRDYELAYRTVLHFAGTGGELPITARLFGELNQQVVIRDATGRPVRVSGFTQGRCEIYDSDGGLIFEGRYYDSRITQGLAGDDALAPIGTRIVQHWENGFGRGAFAGHAFSLGVELRRDGNVLDRTAPALSGQAAGHID